MARTTGASWLLRTQTLLETADPLGRQRVECRWWRLREILEAEEFDRVCHRLSPRHLRDTTGAFNTFLSDLDDPANEGVPTEWLMDLAGLDLD